MLGDCSSSDDELRKKIVLLHSIRSNHLNFVGTIRSLFMKPDLIFEEKKTPT